MERPENRRIMRDLGKVFWLDAPPVTLFERIGEDENRPMLAGNDPLKSLEKLMASRRELYADTSDIHLDTTELAPEEIVERIIAEMGGLPEEDADVFNTIVAIDGPVGSGKSALAKLLANRLDYVHVDTGAMYRCVTLEAMRRGTPPTDTEAVTAIAHSIDIRFVDPEDLEDTPPDSSYAPGEKRVLLNGEDVTDEIRSPEVSRNTSPVADIPAVRAEMVRLQRQLALRGHSVLEGRDISTVVVPEATWQVYLVASIDERVERRFRQYEQQGVAMDRETLRRDVVARDDRDRERAQGALKLAPDAMIFDTTGIGLDEVVETLAAMIEGPTLPAPPAAESRP